MVSNFQRVVPVRWTSQNLRELNNSQHIYMIIYHILSYIIYHVSDIRYHISYIHNMIKKVSGRSATNLIQLDPTTLGCDAFVMGPVIGKCRRQIFPCSKMPQPWHVILVAGPPAAGKLGEICRNAAVLPPFVSLSPPLPFLLSLFFVFF